MGFTISSFLPSRRGSLRVATTVPTMRARIILCDQCQRPAMRAGKGDEEAGTTGVSDPECRDAATALGVPALLRGRGHRGLADGQNVLERLVRPRDHVHGDQLAHTA